jgi:uncharacterized protein
MSRVRLIIKGLSYSQTQTGSYALVLGEEQGNRTLPIIIGVFEAQSIAIGLEKNIQPARPLTHDLFIDFARKFKISFKEVIIHSLKEGIFHASLVCQSEEGKEEVLDIRPSDAVAIATRFDCPVYTYLSILDKAGVVLDQDNSKEIGESRVEIESKTESSEKLKFSLEDLFAELDQAVENEDYEKAARIRDEISKRGNK